VVGGAGLRPLSQRLGRGVPLARLDGELRRRAAARTGILYAFEHDGEDLCNLPFLDWKAALARRLRDTEAGILLNEHISEDGPTVFAHACQLRAEGIVSKRADRAYRSGPCPAWIKVRNPASIAVHWERGEIWNRQRAPLVGDDLPRGPRGDLSPAML
jgi:hypothetical protein